MSAIVLFITQDRDLLMRLGPSSSGYAADALTILGVEHVSDATRQLRLNDCIDAVILDWTLPADCDLPAGRGAKALLLLLGTAPHLPVIVLGDDSNLTRHMILVEHGAQDYLLRRRADTDAVICMVHSAIARKSRERLRSTFSLDAAPMIPREGHIAGRWRLSMPPAKRGRRPGR